MPTTSSETFKHLLSATVSVAAAPTMPEHKWSADEQTVPLYIRAPSQPTSTGTAASVGKELLAATKESSDMFPPLKTALGIFLAVWERCDRTSDVQKDFEELSSKLGPVTAIAVRYQESADANLRKRLEAVSFAVGQLAEAIDAKTERGVFIRAAQSEEDVQVVKTMFRRVSSLLEVFQFEAQARAETMLVEILDRLDTPEQQTLTVDAAQIILAHMEELSTDDENVVNNNSNRNELEGPADLENNNTNETELEVEGTGGGGVVNNNSNVNRIVGSGDASSDGGDSSASSGSQNEGGNPRPRTRITNNNGNKNVIRRSRAK